MHPNYRFSSQYIDIVVFRVTYSGNWKCERSHVCFGFLSQSSSLYNTIYDLIRFLSFRDSHGTSNLKSVETLNESGVEILGSWPLESPANRSEPWPIATTTASRQSSCQLKLSTFSQLPTMTDQFNGAMPNYFTIRNPSRQKHEATLTRAFSETFKAGHLGLAGKADVRIQDHLGPRDFVAAQPPQVALPPAYSHLSSLRNSNTSRRGIVSTSPLASQSFANGDVKQNKDGPTRRDEGTTTPSPRHLTSPGPRELLPTTDKTSPGKFSIRNNHIPQNSDRACSSLDYGLQGSCMTSRCQSVDTNTRKAPMVVALPNRKYAYGPCTDGSMRRTSAAIGKNTGTDSIAAAKTASGTNCGKLQSLTLV